uniref:Uncharacterized protein n=1 Tax=Anguilla anguilla TaxID=7936 RepID=A0A0E9UFE7_ANGAN
MYEFYCLSLMFKGMHFACGQWRYLCFM